MPKGSAIKERALMQVVYRMVSTIQNAGLDHAPAEETKFFNLFEIAKRIDGAQEIGDLTSAIEEIEAM